MALSSLSPLRLFGSSCEREGSYELPCSPETSFRSARLWLGTWCDLLGLLISISDVIWVCGVCRACAVFKSTTRETRTTPQNPDRAFMTAYLQYPGAGRCSRVVRHPGNIKKQFTEDKDRISDCEVKWLSQCQKPVWGYQFILPDTLAAAQYVLFPSRTTLIKRK